MTTLIIFVFLISGNASGGASVDIHEVKFRDAVSCEEARRKTITDDSLWRGVTAGGVYRIHAVCATGAV